MKQKDFNERFVKAISENKISENILDCLKDTKELTAFRALEVYREDYEARMTEALRNTYRATHSILGDDDFFSLALTYLKNHPSAFSDLDEYGHKFSTFLDTHALSDDYPFLPQLARFEWTFRDVFHVKEIRGLNAIQLQESLSDEKNKLTLVPSACLMDFSYAIDQIYSLKDSEEAPENFQYDGHSYILLFKKNSLVKMHTLSKNQWSFVNFFHTPCSLLECIQNAPATMTPEEMQELFLILGTEQILLKS
jgi:hypothetical protein